VSADTPQSGRIYVTTGRLALPVEIRDRRMRLVHRGLSNPRSGEWSTTLSPGIYMVSARLPGGRQVAETVEIRASEDHTVDLAPARTTVAPWAWNTRSSRFQHAVAHFSFDTALKDRWLHRASLFPDPEEVWPDWAFRFLRLEGLSKAVPDQSPRPRQISWSLPASSLTLTIAAPPRAVVFAQITRSAEVPLNVALPTSGNDECLLTTEGWTGLLDVNALPARELAGRAAQFLAAGEEEQAALLISGREAEALLQAKMTDPIGAAIGGYVLLRLHEVERTHDWTDNLAAWFGWLPDGAVIAGEKAAMLGDHRRALTHFLQAGQRGLPIFTDGFSILVSRLRQYQANTHIRAQLTEEQVADVRALSARLEEWSPFVDFSALTLTFRAASITQPIESQRPVEIGDDFIRWRVLWRQ
jgi:hypothetical protein